MKLGPSEMLFLNSAESARMQAKRIIGNGGSVEQLAQLLQTAGDFYRQVAELLLKRSGVEK